jgi:site-specific recombinase XerC
MPMTPVIAAARIEEWGQHVARPGVKPHLATLRMLSDCLVTGDVLPTNPACAVRGCRPLVKTGRPPVLAAEDARTFVDRIDANTMAGLRDRALVCSFARAAV